MTDTPVSTITGASVAAGTEAIELTLDFGIRREFVISPELAIEISFASPLCREVADADAGGC